ncbi:right-handed parallel beta-helix repeat-containing protein [Saccharicrinis sp. 156]|uniref:right-handed parallel beta-helix repeat-containing protein n=1 Tax=Saccharicrinis sp. 156 TaxID=3417574 RepID=UPI003D342161
MKLKTLITFLLIANVVFAKDFFVSPEGNDKNPGSKELPFLSFERALTETARHAGKEGVTFWFSEGSYYLNETLLFDNKYSGTLEKPVVFSAIAGTKVTVKGSKVLDELKWEKYKNGIYVTDVPAGLSFDQLYVNGQKQIRARFPNYDYNNPLRGGDGYQQVTDGTNHRYDEWFSFDPEQFTKKEWENPETGIVHAFQSHNWGNMQYRIKGIDRKENKVLLDEGGWQLQRIHGIGGKGEKSSWFFIDNIFEELDVAEEWFLDTETNQLYYYPNADVAINDLIIEVPVVKDLIQLKGTKENPVSNIHFRGFTFTHSRFTFMEDYEPVARGDWAIHRGGAVFMEGAENCSVEDCNFNELGGNGVFMSAYNRNNQVKNCAFVSLGESGVCFVGSPKAVRFYQTWDDKEIDGKDWNEMRKNMDLEPGPKTPDYPKNCVVENCVMHDFGNVGKQVAGVYISMSHKIRVSHNTIYNCPRAGICINDGTWGGHIIENCDIWETVRETGEHGPFNSWGRERQWLSGSGSNKDFKKELTLLDAIDKVIIRNNRIANYRKSISAGNWTIDLDDGSSNFEIYNNLNLGSTIKLRDGVLRKVYNNITVSAVPLGWHVWPENSEDDVYQNVFVISGAVPGKGEPTKQFARPIRLPSTAKWSSNYDYNLYWNVNFPETPEIIKDKSLKQWQVEGYDLNAIIADPLFVDPQNGDYSLSKNSPALQLGFKNFPMDEFGHEMTRILPFGGDFAEELRLTLRADSRMKPNGTIRYTTDGSEPDNQSPIYNKEIVLNASALVKAQSFDIRGNAIGFVNEAQFNKVDVLTYPSWLKTLLAGKYDDEIIEKTEEALQETIMGALFVNIGDDPDLIDASGGYNSGCFIRSIDAENGQMWLKAGLAETWIIQQLNGNKVTNIQELKQQLKKYRGQTVKVIAVRNYGSKEFKIKL